MWKPIGITFQNKLAFKKYILGDNLYHWTWLKAVSVAVLFKGYTVCMLQNGENKNSNVAEAKHCLLQGPLKV